MIYLLTGYMWLFVHRPFEVWPWLAPYRIERVFMLLILGFWVTRMKTWISCRSHYPVFLLALIYFGASQTSPYATFQTVEDWFKVLVFYVLLVSTVQTKEEVTVLVIAFVSIVAVYELHSLLEYFNGRGHYEMGIWRMVGVDSTRSHSNSFGATIIYALPFLYPVLTAARKWWQKLALAAMFALGSTCVLLTGSRSAFAALIVILGLVSLTSKHRWKIFAAMLLAPPLIWVSLRGDLRERYLTLMDPTLGPENAQTSAEGRSKSFWDGVESFGKSPLFGAGLESYRAKTGMATHNLYNQAFGELGLFGLAVLVGFAWSFFGDFLEAQRLVQDFSDLDEIFLYRVCMAATVSCFLLFFLGWGGHNLDRYNWLWFGAFSGIAVHIFRERTATHSLLPQSEPEFRSLGIR